MMLMPPETACWMCKEQASPGQATTVTVRMPGPDQEDHPAREWVCSNCGWVNRKIVSMKVPGKVGRSRKARSA